MFAFSFSSFSPAHFQIYLSENSSFSPAFSSSCMESCEPGPPDCLATNVSQLASIAELPKARKYCMYEELSEDYLEPYFKVSCFPITIKAEDDMVYKLTFLRGCTAKTDFPLSHTQELLSDIVSWLERYLHHWESGTYCCSRCTNPLYSSDDKYKGPCIWPSFRKPINKSALLERVVFPYNKYTVTVKEVYCQNCRLFVGHQFEDAVAKGDTHPEARWRQ